MSCLLVGCCSMVLSQAALASNDSRTLEFVENRGQWDNRVRYAADLNNGRLFVESGGFTYALFAGNPLQHHFSEKETARQATEKLQAHALRVRFAGTSEQATLSPLDQTAEVRNYARGNDPAQWASNVPSYRQLHYKELWPGIDARLYENQNQQLEYDFDVAAKANPDLVQLQYEGADALTLRPDGALEIHTSVGSITELVPHAWQLDATGQRQAVACRYIVEGRAVHFRLGAYDRRRPLTIDPTIVFSSFTGSKSDNWGFTATYDAQGNLYSGGIVFGPQYPTSLGAYDTSFGGAVDIGIIKYNTTATGSAARVWATYLGGSSTEFPHSLIVNNQGDLLVLGTTSSRDFPVTGGAYDQSFNGGSYVEPYGASTSPTLPSGSDLFITRLSANGASLIGSTFLGGSGNDGILDPRNTGVSLVRNYGDAFRGDILVDAADNVYIASCTSSTNFPVANGFASTYGGGTSDAVVCKLNGSLSNLLWSSYLGGTGPDAAYSLQLDARNNLYVCGGTASGNFPTTAGSLYPSRRGDIDGFVSQISSNGSTIEKSTFLGTSFYDQGYFVQLDNSGNVYVLGQTLGNYPVTPGHYANSGSRQFIHKLTADLSTTDFSTVFGSGRSIIDISPTAFLVDQCDRIFVSGYGGENYTGGNTQGLPVTPTAFQTTTDGSDFYLMQLSAGGTKLEYATFFGGAGGYGEHVDGGTSRFDKRGIVYQAVCGGCGGLSNFPIPAGVSTFSSTNGSTNCNNAAFKFNFEPSAILAGPDVTVCVDSDGLPLVGTPAGGTWSGPGVTGSLATGYKFVPNANLLGQQLLTYTVLGTGLCGGESVLKVNVVPALTAAFTQFPQTSFCLNGFSNPSVTLTAMPAGGTFSGPGVSGNVFYPAGAGSGTHTLTYTYQANGCQARATQVVTVVNAIAGPDFSICSGAAAVRLKGNPAGGKWSGPGVSGSIPDGYVFTPTAALVGSQKLTYTLEGPDGCTSSSLLTATVQRSPQITLPTLPVYCVTNTSAVVLPKGMYWSGRGVSGYYDSFTFVPATAGVGKHSLSYGTYDYGSCNVQGTYEITVVGNVTAQTAPDTVLCPGTTQPFRVRATPVGGKWSGSYVTADGQFTPPAGFTGSVTLTYTASNEACTGSVTRRISVATPPTARPTWSPDYCPQNREAPLHVLFSNAIADASWDFGDNTSAANGSSADHTYTKAGRYQPKVTLPYNDTRCSVTISLPIIEVKEAFTPPNIITPNNDGKNDYFVLTENCPPRVQIFSRWGSKVFESASYQNDWNGINQPDGVYYYLMHTPDGRTSKGWVEIRR
ncbi:DUF7948 domain-containing protein [Hymenobacter jejuensis]|nr:gliding motility-associated C-terminal domain-containing protein [Hymenobacter jejuensis]